MRKKTKESFINIGSGVEKTIKGFAKYIMKKLDVNLKIKYDLTKPNGMQRKKLDLSISKKYGWKSKTSLEIGLSSAINDYLQKQLIKK